MKLALVFVGAAVLVLGIAAIMPILFVRDLLIFCAGMNVALAFRAAEIQRFGKGG